MNITILKVGGSVITEKFSETPKVNSENLRRIAKEISSAWNRDEALIIVHGVGSYGHVIVKRTGIDKGIRTREQLSDFAETQMLQNELDCIVTKCLIGEGVPAFPFQASASAVMNSGKLVKMCAATAGRLADMGMVPVLYGVPAYDKEQKCSILSGDEIAPYLAVKLGARRIIHATNVDGVFTSDPNKNPDAKLIREISSANIDQVKAGLSGSTATDVTGGMSKKISELLGIGIESQIVNALTPGNVTKALKGEEVLGTIIRA